VFYTLGAETIGIMSSSSQLPKLTGIPAARSKAPVLKIRFYLILSLLLACAGIGLFAGVALLTAEPPPDFQQTPRGRGVADVAATYFVSGVPSDVDLLITTTENVTFTPSGSMDVLTFPAWDRVEFTEFNLGSFERHVYLLVLPEVFFDQERNREIVLGVPKELHVLVSVTDNEPPALAALPFLTSQVDTRAVESRGDYSNSDQTRLPATAQEVLRRWAEAWVTDNREELRSISGDNRPGFEFPGLGNHTLGSLSLVSQVATTQGDIWLVRARVGLVSANGTQRNIELDITVAEASTQLPRVVGWGPPGVGIQSTEDVRVALRN